MKLNEVVLDFPDRRRELALKKSLDNTDKVQKEYIADRNKTDEFKSKIEQIKNANWQFQKKFALHPEGQFSHVDKNENHVAYLDSDLYNIIQTPEENRTKKQLMILQFCKQHAPEIISNTKKDAQALVDLYKEIKKSHLRRPFTLLLKIKAALEYYNSRIHFYSQL